MAKGAAQAVGRPRAKRGGAVDRRARAAADGLSSGHLLGLARPVRQSQAGQEFAAELVSVDGRRIPAGKDFDPATGKLKDPPTAADGRAAAHELAARLRTAEFSVATLEDKPYTSKPYPPFTTSTLQQEANRKLGLHGPPHDAGGAEPVRERPHYLHAYRLDQPGQRGDRRGPRAGRVAVRQRISARRRRASITKVKNAQEAHEAIRPAGHPFDFPEPLRGQTERRRVQAVRPDLEADRRQPDGRRPRPAHHDHHRRGRGRVSSRRQDHRLSRLSAGLCRRQRRSGSRSGRKRNGAAGVAVGESARLPRAWSQRATPRSRPAASAKPR